MRRMRTVGWSGVTVQIGRKSGGNVLTLSDYIAGIVPGDQVPVVLHVPLGCALDTFGRPALVCDDDGEHGLSLTCPTAWRAILGAGAHRGVVGRFADAHDRASRALCVRSGSR